MKGKSSQGGYDHLDSAEFQRLLRDPTLIAQETIPGSRISKSVYRKVFTGIDTNGYFLTNSQDHWLV